VTVTGFRAFREFRFLGRPLKDYGPDDAQGDWPTSSGPSASSVRRHLIPSKV